MVVCEAGRRLVSGAWSRQASEAVIAVGKLKVFSNDRIILLFDSLSPQQNYMVQISRLTWNYFMQTQLIHMRSCC
jgi:hypothetical protein